MIKKLIKIVAGTALLLALLALPAYAEQGEANITAQSTMREIRENPSLAASGVYLYGNSDDMITLLDWYYADRSLAEYVCSGSAEDCAQALNLIVENVNAGRQVTYKLYTEQEIAQEPAKEKVELYYFPAEQPGGKYALVMGGNVAATSGELREGLASAWQLREMGYTVFVLRYRICFDVKDNAPLYDVGTAVRYITEHAAEFGVQTEDYAVVGYSAGGHLTGLFGSAEKGWAQFGVPKPGALLMGYPINNYMEAKPVYHLLYDTFSTDWCYYLSDIADVVTEDYPPVYFWYGQNDTTLLLLWLPAQCDALAAKLEECGVPYTLVSYQDAPHASSTGRGTDADGWLYAAVDFWTQQTAE